MDLLLKFCQQVLCRIKFSFYTHRVYIVRVGRFINLCSIYIRQVSHARFLIVMGMTYSARPKIIRPAEVCRVLVTVMSMILLTAFLAFSTTTMVPSSR